MIKIDDIIRHFNIECSNGINILNGGCIQTSVLNKRQDTIIINLELCKDEDELKRILENAYGNNKKIFIYDVNKQKQKEIEIKDIKIEQYGDMCIYIPQNGYSNEMGQKRDIYDLLDLVSILRGENGCPWDKEQNHKSIENSMIEESYEVVDAIERDDKSALKEELGDVLFQIAFHVSLEKDNKSFDFNDIVSGIYDKMVFRHPHVFNKTEVKDVSEVLKNWDNLKNKEKSLKTKTQELDAIASNFPALIRASKVQKKVSKIGFDFKNPEEAALKIKEELKEVLDEYNHSNMDKIKEELGDLLFSVVNFARLLDCDSEESLRISTDKFINRFKFIEAESIKSSKDLQKLSIDEMNFLWEKAKNLEK